MLNSFLYGGVWALYHFVFEGVALLMLNDGVGSVAARKSGFLAGVWAAFTWVVQGWITYQDGSDIAIALSVLWAACLVIFYGALWLMPIAVLFRRPCVFNYARFWCLMRAYICLSNVLRHFNVTFGFCMYLLGSAGFQSPLVAWIVYSCLLRDCKYWLGILSWESSTWNTEFGSHTNTGAETTHNNNATNTKAAPAMDTLRRPLLGTSLAPHSARMLAAKMDSNKGDSFSRGLHPSDSSSSALSRSRRKGVKILNFAFLRIDEPVSSVLPGVQQVVLGSGSSSRVFQGTFRDRPVAIKMIFCPELTPETVVGFYHEATLLAQLQHVNVVEVIGVCVLPPSICLVMELCEGGNLFDFLRSPIHIRTPLTLWRQLSLAWDCCAAVQFLHTHEPAVLHLDIKSLNFLLSRDGRVKVADLELSREILLSSADGGGVISGSELSGFKVPETIYWLAPEIIQGRPYSEKADVYALGLVVWEIFTASVPYRALEDSLIQAAKNVKYLELNGFSTGTYPAPSAALPYSLGSARFEATQRHRITSMDGSASISDIMHSGSTSMAGSRKASLSRGRADSASSAGSTSGRQTPAPVSTSLLVAPRPVAPRRSMSSSSRRYGDVCDEESEMSTPSSSGSRSGAPSPAINIIANGFFIPTRDTQPDTHTHTHTHTPPPVIMTNAAPSTTTPTMVNNSGVSLLTHENLAGHYSDDTHEANTYESNRPTSVFVAVDTDPILFEWKRMHGLLPSGSSLPPPPPPLDFVSPTHPHRDGSKRPSYSSKSALPPIPASGGTSYVGSCADGHHMPLEPHVRIDSNATLASSVIAAAAAAAPVSHHYRVRTDSTQNDDPTSIDQLAHVRSAPAEFTPIRASVESQPARSGDAHMYVGTDLDADAPDDSSLSLPDSPSLHSSVSRLYVAPLASVSASNESRSESYMPYDLDPTAAATHEFDHPHNTDQYAPAPPHAYPASVPSRSLLSTSGDAPYDATDSAPLDASTTIAPYGNPSSSAASPSLTAATERIPRITRITLDSKKKKKKSRSGASRSRPAPPSHSNSSRPKVDFSSIYVGRHDVQSQLEHLICVAHYRPTIPPDMPDQLAALLTRAWHPAPNMRPTATEFVQAIANLTDQLRQQTERNTQQQEQTQPDDERKQ